MVAFNSAVGSSVALVAWYPSRCGYVGFAVIILVVAGTAIGLQRGMISTSCRLNAGTFDQLCEPLPDWSNKVTVISFLIFYWACTAFYCQFFQVFFGDQVCPRLCGLNSTFLCHGEDRVAILVFLLVSLVSFPAQLGGTAATVINYANFGTKWVIVVAAVLKGIHTTFFATPSDGYVREYVAFDYTGVLSVTSMLFASFANTGIMPQIAADVDRSQQERAANVAPLIAVSMQTLVFLAIAYAGYFALDGQIRPTVFATYNELYPGFLVTVLQTGMAFLTYLSQPLLVLPLKAQIWALLAPAKEGETPDLSKAPPLAQGGLTLAIAFLCSMVPAAMGPEAFTNLMIFLSCTCGLWMSVFLPAMVLLYCQVWSPEYRGNKSVAKLLCGWLFVLGVLGVIDAFISNTGSKKEGPSTRVPLGTRCANWAPALAPTIPTDPNDANVTLF